MYFGYDNVMTDTVFFYCVQSGRFVEDMIPTVGFNMRKVTKGNVTIKVCLMQQMNLYFAHLELLVK